MRAISNLILLCLCVSTNMPIRARDLKRTNKWQFSNIHTEKNSGQERVYINVQVSHVGHGREIEATIKFEGQLAKYQNIPAFFNVPSRDNSAITIINNRLAGDACQIEYLRASDDGILVLHLNDRISSLLGQNATLFFIQVVKCSSDVLTIRYQLRSDRSRPGYEHLPVARLSLVALLRQ